MIERSNIPRTDVSQYVTPTPKETPVFDNGRLRQEIANAKKTPVRTVTINDDEEFHALVAHALKRGESLMEFVARSGLSKRQILDQHMSPIEILNFVNNAEARNEAERVIPRSVIERKPLPSHFTIDE